MRTASSSPSSDSSTDHRTLLPDRPNILLILVDQLQFPRFSYGDAGFHDGIKAILSFYETLADNPFKQHFPGFLKLREYATVLTNHTIAESACIPSRTSVMTGQYGTRTGVTQTDGLFKSGDARNFPWLPENGTPTMGDWFREAGYSTHYFGKWHVSNPPDHTLREYGFDDWDLSWPEPHGALLNNLGAYRDYQFADLGASFLRRRGLGVPYDRATGQQDIDHPRSPLKPRIPPFFAVISFTNPHDIAAYPGLTRQLAPSRYDPTSNTWVADPDPYSGPGDSVPVPLPGTWSATPVDGTMRLPLNPTGFPQDNADATPTQDEDLLTNNKPSSHYEQSYKVGLGLAAKGGHTAAMTIRAALAKQGKGLDVPDNVWLELAVAFAFRVGVPFGITDDPDGATKAFVQYYAYAIYMVDRHILTVLDALDQSGLRDSTVVMFTSDHGEYAGAHGKMMEKWHAAYQEAVHVPVVVSHPAINGAIDRPQTREAQTSHIDLLPTLLGLAGIGADERQRIRHRLSKTHLAAPLLGADLSGVIRDGGEVLGPDGKIRESVLFVTDDMISEPLPQDADPHNVQSWQQFEVFRRAVDVLRGVRSPDLPEAQIPAELLEKLPAEPAFWGMVPDLKPGAVSQPAHVRALRSGPWKLVRNCDPWSAVPVADEWELYNLEIDGNEATNLVVYNAPFPTLIDPLPATLMLNAAQLTEVANRLHAELQRQEALHLRPYPSAHPTAGATAGR